jgi:hypothetical protein
MTIHTRAIIALAALVALSGATEAGSKKKCSSCGASTGFQNSPGGYAASGNWGGADYSASSNAGWNFSPQGTWPAYGGTNAAWGYGGNGPGPFYYGPVIPLVAPGDELVW